MKRIALLAVTVSLVAMPAFAEKKSCDELKAEIEAKLKAKGVTSYMLAVVAADQVKGEKVVGSCDGGTKRITYKR